MVASDCCTFYAMCTFITHQESWAENLNAKEELGVGNLYGAIDKSE
jgi:hypothetical protein